MYYRILLIVKKFSFLKISFFFDVLEKIREKQRKVRVVPKFYVLTDGKCTESDMFLSGSAYGRARFVFF
jgi:hypothetical protein